MHLKALFSTFKSKMVLIYSIASLATLLMFLFKVAIIELLIVIWNFSFMASIIYWDREKRRIAPSSSLPDDQEWSKIKTQLSKVDREIKKGKGSRKVSLERQRSSLHNELRRIEWSLKESDLGRLYSSQRGRLRRVRENKTESGTPAQEDAVSSSGKFLTQQELETSARKNLADLLSQVEAILRTEPQRSRSSALQPVANDLRAHFNSIKKKSRKGRPGAVCLSDYWIAWAIVISIINGVSIDRRIVKYSSSKETKKGMSALLKLLEETRRREEQEAILSGRSPLKESQLALDEDTISLEQQTKQSSGEEGEKPQPDRDDAKV